MSEEDNRLNELFANDLGVQPPCERSLKEGRRFLNDFEIAAKKKLLELERKALEDKEKNLNFVVESERTLFNSKKRAFDNDECYNDRCKLFRGIVNEWGRSERTLDSLDEPPAWFRREMGEWKKAREEDKAEWKKAREEDKAEWKKAREEDKAEWKKAREEDKAEWKKAREEDKAEWKKAREEDKEWRNSMDEWRKSMDEWRKSMDEWRKSMDEWRKSTDEWRKSTDERLENLLNIVREILDVQRDMRNDLSNLTRKVDRMDMRLSRNNNMIMRSFAQPITEVPFFNGDIPDPNLPRITRIEDIDSLSEENCTRYLKGYGVSYDENDQSLWKRQLAKAVGLTAAYDESYTFSPFSSSE
ncbi:DUF1773 family protein, with repeat expansion [Schizosaccharomyces pombe]|uniref:Meiotic driver tdk1 n=1 Tax=Schizosaccharomyces pombe (strain 972 / ATCC 24843) TaxID=284812 RepID=TDK1_SCHPO|nr:protein mug135 [Schizosaccharomyces pombe]O74876.1 RecName: Full=Meiotically up-regulated gene 135 protein [Schizosaccharomyces pombe 972h-]CAA20909.1 cell surface glycoprotein (predicted), DUF1773 family protein 3 [Schizosaccharomyces pombe]|eukprot:NP_587704.1 protein mug135 [Schizosaccharomyces pombe]